MPVPPRAPDPPRGLPDPGTEEPSHNVDDDPVGIAVKAVDDSPTQAPCKALSRDSCTLKDMQLEGLADDDQPVKLDSGEATAKLMLKSVRIAKRAKDLALCSGLGFGTAALIVALPKHKNCTVTSACGKNCTTSNCAANWPSQRGVVKPSGQLAAQVCKPSSMDILPIFPDDPYVGSNISLDGDALQLTAQYTTTLLMRVVGEASDAVQDFNVTVTFIDSLRNSTACLPRLDQEGDYASASAASADSADSIPLLSEYPSGHKADPPTVSEQSYVKFSFSTELMKATFADLPDRLEYSIGAPRFEQGDGSRLKTVQAVRLLASPASKKAFLCVGIGTGMGFIGDLGHILSLLQKPISKHVAVVIGSVVGSVGLSAGVILGVCIIRKRHARRKKVILQKFKREYGQTDL